MPFRKLFLSRWSALLWAAGVVWTAVDVADMTPTSQRTTGTVVKDRIDATGDAVADNDLSILANVMRGD